MKCTIRFLGEVVHFMHPTDSKPRPFKEERCDGERARHARGDEPDPRRPACGEDAADDHQHRREWKEFLKAEAGHGDWVMSGGTGV